MNKVRYYAKKIKDFLKTNSIATMPELKIAVGSSVDMTILRKLQQLGYRSSYSHRGKYYTLNSIAQFDKNGLWSYNTIRFSIYGTLIDTCLHFIRCSKEGYSVQELNTFLGIETKQALRGLFYEYKIERETIGGLLIYFAKEDIIRKKQATRRYDSVSIYIKQRADKGDGILAHELKAAIILFYSLLDEKHSRLYAGLESLKIGHGGDRSIAKILGIDPRTVARGRKELLSKPEKTNRIRKAGGGRKSVKKTSQT